MLARLKDLSESFQDFIYPPRCIVCHSARSYLCPACRSQITLIAAPVCSMCGYPKRSSHIPCRQCANHPLEHLDGIRSAALFTGGPLRKAIHRLKYKGHFALAKTLAPLLVRCYTAHQLNTEVIVPVPLHPSRHRERGFNQSMVLARALAGAIRQPVDAGTLIRHRATRSQMTLNAAERKENVARAFTCRTDRLAGKTVLLLDDVCTTGATLDACAQALKERGVRRVYGLTLARAL